MVKTQSEIIFTEETHKYMSCQQGSNEIDRFGLPDNEEYVGETDIGDEPLRGQDSLRMQIGKRSTTHIHEASDEEAKNTHSLHLC
jgi:hypothetical protein